PPVFKMVEGPYRPFPTQAAYAALNPTQRARAESAHARTFPVITNLQGGDLVSTESPVMLIGDSYNEGLQGLLGKEINIPVHPHFGPGQTIQAFTDFLREPELLRNCKVVVWLLCNPQILPPLPVPAPIRAAQVDQ